MVPISSMLLVATLFLTFSCAYRIANMSYLFFRQHAHADGSLHPAERIKDQVLKWRFLSQSLQKANQRKRREAMESELPEVLRLLCTALESGSSLVMGLRYAANNCNEPLSSELKRTVWDLEAGQSFDEAIQGLRIRTNGAEFAYLSVAMEIQHKSGGSLTEILESVSSMLKQSAELKDELRTKTAQGRLSSRIVAGMPFALLAVFTVFSPGYLLGFFSSAFGILLFMFALLLEAVGVVLVVRALKIDFTVDLEGGA